jgi:capsular polysaccharide biosynthesis protein
MKKTLNRILATVLALVLAIPIIVTRNLPAYAAEADDEAEALSIANSLLSVFAKIFGTAQWHTLP